MPNNIEIINELIELLQLKDDNALSDNQIQILIMLAQLHQHLKITMKQKIA